VMGTARLRITLPPVSRPLVPKSESSQPLAIVVSLVYPIPSGL